MSYFFWASLVLSAFFILSFLLGYTAVVEEEKRKRDKRNERIVEYFLNRKKQNKEEINQKEKGNEND